MKKAFSLASWNVEHLNDCPKRLDRVIDFMAKRSPDVFALMEVEGKTVFAPLMEKMPGYRFHITEGPQTQEILVGVKKRITAFFTQKAEFKSGNPYLRPGSLLTIRVEGRYYSILFLHTKSSPTPVGMGLRDDILGRAFLLKEHLDRACDGAANYIIVGDLNIMGMDLLGKRGFIAAETELDNLDRCAKKAGMRRLPKDAPATWWNGPRSSYPASDLDHVVASSHLRFRKKGGAEARVLGWPKEQTEAAMAKWIEEHSDHGMVWVEVERE